MISLGTVPGGHAHAAGGALPAAKKALLREYLEALAIALVLAVLVRSFVVQAFKIPSGSMLPTLQVGDYVLVNKFSYGLKLPFVNGWLYRYADPTPGDVIVFRYADRPDTDYIKRVVAVAGEEVEIRDKQVLVDGLARYVAPAYFVHGRQGVQDGGPRDNFGPAAVPAGHVFVLGDNRDRSFDSRYWGPVSVDGIKGKALIIYWSQDERNGAVRWERLGKSIQWAGAAAELD